MNTLLIIKCGAAGDVVRTTSLLHLFRGWEIHWLTAPENKALLENDFIHRIFDTPQDLPAGVDYELIINLEDDQKFVAVTLGRVTYRNLFGSYIGADGRITYTEDAAEWFDMGLISKHGLKGADSLKLKNRKSYQEMLFSGLGHTFSGEQYVMPNSIPRTSLSGDVAVAPEAGSRWPIKNWAFFGDLVEHLARDYTVNVLPIRPSLPEHLADVGQHRLVVSPDSLPMHIAMGMGNRCISIFTCTSPWEIYDYGLLTKVISPKLSEYFYRRDFVDDAVRCISLGHVEELARKLLMGDRNPLQKSEPAIHKEASGP